MNKKIKIGLVAFLATQSILLADMDRCVSCHGVDFEKKALGVSKVVKDMSEIEIKKALDGYKAGIGGSMKELMISEVNLGVDTNAMAADVYNESRTAGFDEPSDEFIFQKRLNVRSLHKLITNIKKAKKDDMKKISTQIKAIAFNMYTYDKQLQSNVHFNKFQAKKINKKDILKTVTKVKKCVDHSFTVNDMAKCEVGFFNLAGTLSKNEEKKMKVKSAKNKAPLYKGKDSVDISKYLHHK